MAADDAAVVVTLRANLKDYEAALKSAVRSTETAARAAEKAVSGIGKGGGASRVIEANFKKSSAVIANDARNLQFQLNDIFSGIATGQGVRGVQMQLGQIAQLLSGQGLGQAARTLASGLVAMVNPINLAVVAFGVLLPLAVAYFSTSTEKAKEAAEALRKQADELDKLADKYGKMFPILQQLANEHRRAAEEAEKHLALETALAAAYEDSTNAIEKLRPKMTLLISSLAGQGQTEAAAKLQDAFNNLSKKIDEHKAKAEDVEAVLKVWNEITTKYQGLVGELTKDISGDLLNAVNKVGQAWKDQQETLKGMANQIPFGGPSAITSPERLRNALLGGTPQDAAMERWIDAIDGFTERIIQAEGGTATAKNPKSSATGFGQFIDSTWLEVFKRNFATEAAGMSDAAILALRSDLETNRRMIRAYATENAKALDAAHQAVTERNLQLAHFLGSADAIKVLQAAPGTRIADLLSQKKINANQSVLGGGATREDVLGYAARRAGATTKAAQEEKRAYQDLIATITEKTAAQQRENEISGDLTKNTGERTEALQKEKAAQEAARVEKELNNAAMRDGIPLTDELKAKNHELAEAYAAAGLQADQLQVAQQKVNQITEEQRQAADRLRQQIESMMTGALQGFAHDLMNGVEAGEAFGNMLKNIASQIVDLIIQMMVVKPLMNALFPGTGGGGGGFGGLFHAGGTVGLSAGQRDHRQFSPLMWTGAPRYAAGGMVGLRPGEMPIIAHRGEIIIPNARRLAGSMQSRAMQAQKVEVAISAAPSPLLDLTITKRTKAAEERAIARGPAVARNNNQRYAVP